MKSFVKTYSRIMDFLVLVIKIVVAIALVVMVAVTFTEVIRRYALGKSFVWADELTRFLLIGITFIGGAAAYKTGGMACFDLIISKLSEKSPLVPHVFRIITNICIAAFSMYLALNAYSYNCAPMVQKMKSTGLKLPMKYVYITIPIGFVLIVLFAIEQILQSIAAMKGEEK